MPRSKVKLAFIENYNARKNSFMKRKECVKKKMEELSILCGVDACGILYSPYSPQPEVWPDNHNVVAKVLSTFLRTPAMVRNKYMVNHEDYIKDRISKVKEQIKKQKMTNHEMAMENLMSECLSGKVLLTSLDQTQMNELVLLANQKIADIDKTIKALKSKDVEAVPPQPVNDTASGMVVEGREADVYVPVMENNGVVDEMDTGTDWYPPDWICNLLMEA